MNTTQCKINVQFGEDFLNAKTDELQQKYIEQMDSCYADRDYFIDFTKCDVCSSKNLRYSQRQNGIIMTCKDCEAYYKSRE